MSEKRMRELVISALAGWDPIAIEPRIKSGIPDVNYVHGWIELKELDAWPVRHSTIVQLPHFTPEQRRWLRRRHTAGGRAHVLLKVKNDWLLFHAHQEQLIGYSTKSSLIESSIWTRVGDIRDVCDLFRTALLENI